MSVYTLPELGYDYAALEPHISARIMELHHSKHHAAYVAGANGALEAMAEARATGSFANINRLEKDLAFHLGGHITHSIFWTNLSPDGGDKPEASSRPRLMSSSDRSTSSSRTSPPHPWEFRVRMGRAVVGSDRAWLIIQQLFDQQGNTAQATVPLLQLDMWEHAFYLDYVNVKADYVKAFWNIVNWQNVAARFAAARSHTDGLLLLS